MMIKVVKATLSTMLSNSLSGLSIDALHCFSNYKQSNPLSDNSSPASVYIYIQIFKCTYVNLVPWGHGQRANITGSMKFNRMTSVCTHKHNRLNEVQ